jgi:CRISPR type III-A-associated RAMP protein Csm4
MNPGLVVKLRPTGPWRIGPESGARNQVDGVYHSDSLYGAVTSAMARLGSLAEWLDATARSAAPSVCFSSCFPFVEEIGFVAPPRTVWPPAAAAVSATRVRWKSARFVPLGIVHSILAGERLDDGKWSVDGASGCLLPAGRPGPYRTGVRSNAAVDRLTGAAERHSTACLEFRPGAGLWTVVSFADNAARDRWQGTVQAAFRWLADSGFGGERSRGWGRSEAPEFVEGTLPRLILGRPRRAQKQEKQGPGAGSQKPAAEQLALSEVSRVPEAEEQGPGAGGQGPETGQLASAEVPRVPEAAEQGPGAGGQGPETGQIASAEVPRVPEAEEQGPGPGGQGPAAKQIASAEVPRVPETAVEEPSPVPPVAPPPEEPPALPVEEPPIEEPPVSEPPAQEEPEPEPLEEASQREKPDIAGFSAASDDDPESTPEPEPAAESEPPAPVSQAPAPGSYWLLSLYTPASTDTVDWTRGNYSVVNRGGRVDASGELKKQVAMIAEGSVVVAAGAPVGSAPDVAPDGCAHPVFRAGFAVAIPLGEAS